MLWFGKPKCPINQSAQEWVQTRMHWLVGQFGKEKWLQSRAVQPTHSFFPDPFDASEESIRLLLDRVCGYIGVKPSRVVLQFHQDERAEMMRHLQLEGDRQGAAGLYHADDREVVSINTSHMNDPAALVATIAHELAHARLLGEGRVSGNEEDHERLTDLTTVFFGLGIFNANCTMRFSQWSQGQTHGWKASSIGYLNEEMFGYALALWSLVRGEEKPAWQKHLRTNPRSYMKQAMRYLHDHPPKSF